MTPCRICGAPPMKAGGHGRTWSDSRSARAPSHSSVRHSKLRIEVSDVDALFAELHSAGVLQDVSRAGVTATDFGTTEFATLDDDGNLLTFFRWADG